MIHSQDPVGVGFHGTERRLELAQIAVFDFGPARLAQAGVNLLLIFLPSHAKGPCEFGLSGLGEVPFFRPERRLEEAAVFLLVGKAQLGMSRGRGAS